MKLIILSSDFPLNENNAEYSLLSSQLRLIQDLFDEIIILPTNKLIIPNSLDKKNYRIISGFRNIDLNFILSYFINLIRNLCFIIQDLRRIPLNKVLILSFMSSVWAFLKGIYLFTFIQRESRKLKFKISDSIIYSFWFDDYVFGASLLKLNYSNLKIIVGGHGYDIYPERRKSKRIPFRELNSNQINNIICDSHEGKKYLKSNYKTHSDKIIYLRSSMKSPTNKIKKSNDGVFRILTLSRTHPVKRLDYLIQKLKEIESFSSFSIHYYHVGGGPELNDLKVKVKDFNFKKFKIFFIGELNQSQLDKFFDDNSIDVFLNVSSSEGTSMALIKALSYSIPVILTNVGGNKEIGEYTKTLLNINYTSQDLFKYLERLYKNNDYYELLSYKSINYWEKHYQESKIKPIISKIFNDLK